MDENPNQTDADLDVSVVDAGDAMPEPSEATGGSEDDAPSMDSITIGVKGEPVTVDKETRVTDLKEMFPDVNDEHTATYVGGDGELYKLNDDAHVTDYLDDGDKLSFRLPTTFGHARHQ